MKMRGVARALVGVYVAGSLTGAALAQDGFVWDYSRYLDADPFQTRLDLSYAIPETDAIQFWAHCEIGAGGTYATIEVGAEIGGLPNDTTIDVQFVGRGFNRILTGTVVGVGAEVGLTGASLPVELDDPLWQAIVGLSELHYNVTGFTALRLPLSGSSGPTQQFLADCRDMPGPDDADGPQAGPGSTTPPPSAPPQPVAPNTVSCSAFGSLRSVDGGAPAEITFVNRTDGYRSVMWLDYEATPQPYHDLNPGEAYTQSTITGHPWMIVDGPGNCLEIYMPPAGGSVFEITAPNQYFGPE